MSLRRPVMRTLLVAPLVAIAVAACTGFGVGDKRQLDEARQQLADAERDPVVRTHAASFLAIADKTLQEARTADDPAEARHLIYLAQRRVEIARSVGGLKLAAARLENLPAESAASAGVSKRARSPKKVPDVEAGPGKDETDRQTAVRPAPETSDLSVVAPVTPVPPKKPETGRGAGPETQASLPKTERQGTGSGEERIWKVLPIESLFADAELLRLAPSVERDLAPLVRFLRENEGSIVLIKGNLVKDKPTEKELALSVHAAEVIKEHLVEADIDSNRIFTIGRIENGSDRAGSEAAKKNFPVGQVEIALFNAKSPPKPVSP